MSSPLRARRHRFVRTVKMSRSLQARQRRIELWLDHRYPKLYDARHAATGIGRALWPLVGPLLLALLFLPVIALLAALVAVLNIEAPSIDLPSVDLPSIPFPDIDPPGWLRAISEALGAALGVIVDAAKYVAIAGVVIFGLLRTRDERRKREAAERIGRPELLRRLAVTLGAVAASARAQGAGTVLEASAREEEPE